MKIPKPRKLKSGSWFIQLRLGGESIPVTARTEKECSRRAALIKAEYLAGERRAPEAPEPKLPTLSEAIDKYLDIKSNVLSPATVRGYRVIQRNRFAALMGRSLSDISDEEWVRACNDEAARCSAKTLSNAWRFATTVCRQIARRELPPVTLPQVAPRERPFLDAEQIRVFIAAVKGSDVEIPALLALCSLRRSEICALTWDNVDLERRRIYVKSAAVYDEDDQLTIKPVNKNPSSTRSVPILIGELYEALERERKSSGPVVQCAPNTIRARVNRVCADNGLPEVGTHGLRHSFASLAYHLGVPEQVTMEIGGWADMQTMRRIYTHIAQADIDRYEERFGEFFGAAGGGSGGEKC